MRAFIAITSLLLIAACGGSGGGQRNGNPEATALELFDQLWSDFDANYSFFQLKNFDWDDARTRYRSQLTATSSDAELNTVLSSMLLELEDGHVRLTTPFGESTYTGWFDQFPENFDRTIVSATYLGQTAMMTPRASLLFGQAAPNIGYVHIDRLSANGYGADIDMILDQLAGVSAMIVDLRNNGGGNDLNGEEIVGRFADTLRVYRRVQFRNGPEHGDFGPLISSNIAPSGAQSFQGPVAVLTNRRVFSSAESLTLAFDVLPNAISYGDFTGGGSANPAQRSLSNGWQYTVSQWVEFRPDGTTFEGVGIEPDVRVDVSDADAAMLRDTILDAAIADLQTRLANAAF